MFKKLTINLLMLSLLASLIGCSTNNDDDDDDSSSGDVDSLSALTIAATALSSGGEALGDAGSSALSYALSARSRRSSDVVIMDTETTSDALTYCSQYGRAWDDDSNDARTPGDTDYALHMIECTARIDESTETPQGFLSQMAFIACALNEAGADIETAGTYSDIEMNPSEASTACNALTEANIKDDDNDYTFDVVVEDNPADAGWDKVVSIEMEGNPFQKFYLSQTSTGLAIKGQEWNSGAATGIVEVVLDQDAGVLLFEMTSIRNPGHTRLRLDGVMSSTGEFSSVESVQGAKIICHSDGCSTSYEGGTLKGDLPDSLGFESLQVTSSSTCALGDHSSCAAQTGTDCDTFSCISYGNPTTSAFADSDNFDTDIEDVASGPLCFSDVTAATAPDRAELADCSF